MSALLRRVFCAFFLATAIGAAVERPPLSGAVYVDAWEIRKEITVNPLVLQGGTDLGIAEMEPVTPAQREEMKEKVLTFLAEALVIRIDGNPANFEPEDVRFHEAEGEEPPEIGSEDRMVWYFQIVASYAAPLPAIDSEITAEWTWFPLGAEEVPVSIAGPQEEHLQVATADEPQFPVAVELPEEARATPAPPPAPELSTTSAWWLTIPLLIAVALALWKRNPWIAGVGAIATLAAWAFWKPITTSRPSDQEIASETAREIVERVLENIYHGFNLHNESAQYDALATVLAGEALEQTYLEARRTREKRTRDDARVTVSTVSVKEAIPTPLPERAGFSADCKWLTEGRIGHWGHFHDRKNLYAADLDIEVVDGMWKATQFQLESRERQ